MIYKLGKRPARLGAIAFRFGAYFDRRNLPEPPARFGHDAIGRPWGVLANDEHSCCVFSGAAHETMVWGHEAGAEYTFQDANVLADYSAVTGYDPADPQTDAGTDMQQAASYRRKVGIVDDAGMRHRIDAYAALRPGDVNDLAIATYLTGSTGVGLRFPASAMDQFDAEQPFDVVDGSPYTGGHYVPCIGRNSKGNFLVVTWGRIQAMTPQFYEKYCDEAVCYLSLEALGTKGLSPEGFSADQLRRNLAELAA